MNTFTWDGFAVYQFVPKEKKSEQKILFSHANGIAAGTYQSLLQKWADDWGIEVFAYDVRGMGGSEVSPQAAYKQGKKYIWKYLTIDLVNILEMLKTRFPSSENWILSGHSLGGWLSLLAAKKCGVKEVLLLDIPMLPPSQVMLWSLAVAAGMRRLHPLGKVARRRKRKFHSLSQAKTLFRRNPFFKKWSFVCISDFVDANYEERSSGCYLRHSTNWEADIFEHMPLAAAQLMIKIPKKLRQEMNIYFIVGGKSTVCNPQAGKYFKTFFPKTIWKVCDGGEHMFPFENTETFFTVLNDLCWINPFEKDEDAQKNSSSLPLSA